MSRIRNYEIEWRAFVEKEEQKFKKKKIKYGNENVRACACIWLMIIFIDQFQSELSVSAILSCEETNISLEFKDRWSKVI